MHPSEITGQVTFLYCDDLGATSAFYQDVLGLERVVDQGCCHIYRLSPSGYLGVCDIADGPRETAGLTVTLVTDDVDGWHRALSSKGVVFEREPAFSERFQVYSCLFHDPNGYRIEIQSFRDPDWHRALEDNE